MTIPTMNPTNASSNPFFNAFGWNTPGFTQTPGTPFGGWNGSTPWNGFGGFGNGFQNGVPGGFNWNSPWNGFNPSWNWTNPGFQNIGGGFGFNAPNAWNGFGGISPWNGPINTGGFIPSNFIGGGFNWNNSTSTPWNGFTNGGFINQPFGGFQPGFQSGFQNGFQPGFQNAIGGGFNTVPGFTGPTNAPNFNTHSNTNFNPNFTGSGSGFNPGVNSGFGQGFIPGFFGFNPNGGFSRENNAQSMGQNTGQNPNGQTCFGFTGNSQFSGEAAA